MTVPHCFSRFLILSWKKNKCRRQYLWTTRFEISKIHLPYGFALHLEFYFRRDFCEMRYPDKSPSDSRCYENFFPTRTSRLRYYSIRFINVRFCWLFSNIVNLIRRKWSIFDVLKSQLSHVIYDNDFGFGFLDIKIMKKKTPRWKL